MLAFLLAIAISLVPGSTSVWTDGIYTWGGNPFCAEAGFLLSPESPAIDAGEYIEGFHCSSAGLDPSGCVEWFGSSPDIGACEYWLAQQQPSAPKGITIE